MKASSIVTITDLRPLPRKPNLQQYKKQAKALLKSVKDSDPGARARFERFHPRTRAAIALADAQAVLAREHGFESWPKFAAHIEALRRADTSIAAFESAADAIAAGDIEALAELLSKNPHLVRERSSRTHRATLLHYTGANGVEDYRQKTPPNVAEVAKLLLRAGAEADALADIYGSSTTLSLAVSSVHPLRMGVQIALMESLLAGGAAIDGVPGCPNPILGALRNGRGEAALFLAEQGAALNLESAAGVGRADLVEAFVRQGVSSEQDLSSALAWASEYGRVSVVDFLLRSGVDVNRLCHGQAALHWAAIGSQPEMAQFLLSHGASLDVLNMYGGTPLGQAQWCAEHSDDPGAYTGVIEILTNPGIGQPPPYRP